MGRPRKVKKQPEIKEEAKPVSKKCIIHIVKPGENVQTIASLYGKNVQEFVAKNGTSVYIGQRIRIY